MIIKCGYVSNSSSMSFICSKDDYPNVFELAKTMIRIRDREWYRVLSEEERVEIVKEENLIKKLEEAEKKGMNPNTPVVFGTINYDTYIMELEGDLYVDTCNNHGYWEDIKILTFDDEGDYEDKEKGGYDFYSILKDKMVREKTSAEIWSEIEGKHSNGSIKNRIHR